MTPWGNWCSSSRRWGKDLSRSSLESCGPGPGEGDDPFGSACFAGLLVEDDRAASYQKASTRHVQLMRTKWTPGPELLNTYLIYMLCLIIDSVPVPSLVSAPNVLHYRRIHHSVSHSQLGERWRVRRLDLITLSRWSAPSHTNHGNVVGRLNASGASYGRRASMISYMAPRSISKG